MNSNKLWVVSGPHLLKLPNGDFDGDGWQVNRPSRTGGLSAREWVMDGNYVKFFRSEKAAIAMCNKLNKFS